MKKIMFSFLFIILIVLLLITGLPTHDKQTSVSPTPISVDEMTLEQRQIADRLIETEWAVGRLPFEERYQKLSDFYTDDPRYALSEANQKLIERMKPFLPESLSPPSSWGQLTLEKAWMTRGKKGQELFEKMEKGQITASELERLQQQGLEPLQARPTYQKRSEVSQMFVFYNFEKRDDGSICVEHSLGITKARTCLVERKGQWYIAFREINP